MVFNKGEFLAVRNDEGTFFICRTAQKVFKNSRKFKIRWLSNEKGTDPTVYNLDFYDQTDFECVLTNLRLEKINKNSFQLPEEEKKRTQNILERALNVEKGVTVDPRQFVVDGVDVSFVGKAEEKELARTAKKAARSEAATTDTEQESSGEQVKAAKSGEKPEKKPEKKSSKTKLFKKLHKAPKSKSPKVKEKSKQAKADDKKEKKARKEQRAADERAAAKKARDEKKLAKKEKAKLKKEQKAEKKKKLKEKKQLKAAKKESKQPKEPKQPKQPKAKREKKNGLKAGTSASTPRRSTRANKSSP